MNSSPSQTAILLGATGLIGSHCLQVLESTNVFSSIIDAGRRPSEFGKSKTTFVPTDFENASALKNTIKGDVIFCCLGTTHAKAGSKEAFRKVDFEYVFNAARAGQENGVKHFFLVSSMGADPASAINYSKVKGEIEAAVSRMDFESVHIFRPSMLLGERIEKRPGEKIYQKLASFFSFLLVGPLKNYAAISAETVAKAMVTKSLNPGKGVFLYLSGEIAEIGNV